jgi:hypothetical protein
MRIEMLSPRVVGVHRMRAGRVEISTMPDLFTARDGCAALRPAARDGCAATAEEEAIAAIVGKVKSPSSTFSAE